MKTLLTILTFLFLSSTSLAKEDARPNSSDHNQLVEFNFGLGRLDGETEKIVGVDYEFFPEKFEHHFSLGYALEVDSTFSENFYHGPLFALYYYHTKLFYTSGIETNLDDTSCWANKLGAAYEFHVAESRIFVPNLILNHSKGETSLTFGIGLAFEF